MQYYTYKVTFKDLPKYFYYGRHKDNDKPYFGTPVTWKHLWGHFEPEVQILQWYETGKEADAAEKAIIRATWDSKYSLNENAGGCFSEEVCRANGRKTIGINFDHHRSANGNKTGPENVKSMLPYCSDNGKKTGPENGKKAGAANGKKTGGANGKVRSKRVLLTSISTGQTFEFFSAREACRVLGLDQGNLCSVARGEGNSHKGYTAVYLQGAVL